MNVIDMSERTPAQKQGLLSHLVVPRPIDPEGGANVAPYSSSMPVSGELPLSAVTVGAQQQDTPGAEGHPAQHRAHRRVRRQRHDRRDLRAPRGGGPRAPPRRQRDGRRPLATAGRRQATLADSPAHLECRVLEVIDRGDHTTCYSGVHVVLAEAVCITTDDSTMFAPGRIDPTLVRAVGRTGFPWFVAAGEELIVHRERVSYAELNRARVRQLTSTPNDVTAASTGRCHPAKEPHT